MTMLQNGVDAKTALLLTNPYKDTISRESVSKLRRKFKQYSLQAPKTVKLAHQAVKDALTNKPIEFTTQKVTKDGEVVELTETIMPSYTNKLAAASMVYDRYEPSIKVQANINIDVDPIDLGSYKNAQSGAENTDKRDPDVIDC
jgi:hypothetical protein